MHLLALARGHRDPAAALADGSVQVFGDPGLIAQLPSWFLPADAPAADARTEQGTGAAPGLPSRESELVPVH